jgi:hypothetical protein
MNDEKIILTAINDRFTESYTNLDAVPLRALMRMFLERNILIDTLADIELGAARAELLGLVTTMREAMTKTDTSYPDDRAGGCEVQW